VGGFKLGLTERGRWTNTIYTERGQRILNEEFTETGFFVFGIGGQDTVPPLITIVLVTTGDQIPTEAPYVASKVTGKNEISIIFTANENIQAWRVESGGVGMGTGTLLTSGSSASSGEQITAVFNTSSFGSDGEYRINIYAQDIAGNWVPYNQV
jgi:hypothetical protein